MTVLSRLIGEPLAESITSPLRTKRGVSCIRGVIMPAVELRDVEQPAPTDGVAHAPPGVAAVRARVESRCGGGRGTSRTFDVGTRTVDMLSVRCAR